MLADPSICHSQLPFYLIIYITMTLLIFRLISIVQCIFDIRNNHKLAINFAYSCSMADQIGFEEVVQADWLDQVSRYTDKHMPTHSQVSKDYFFDQIFDEGHDNNSLFSTKNQSHQRQRNKCNAKNYRDRKRIHLEAMKNQIQLLHHQNQLLKNQKCCRFCHRSFSPSILLASQANRKQNSDYANCKHLEKDMQIQFQKPELKPGTHKQRNPKVWIALGILMLVLGLTLHGFEGDKTYINKIELEKEDIRKWSSMLKENKHQYFEVSMRLKEEATSSRKQEVRLHFQQPTERSSEKEEKISINKELLFSIHAELDDIGLYL